MIQCTILDSDQTGVIFKIFSDNSLTSLFEINVAVVDSGQGGHSLPQIPVLFSGCVTLGNYLSFVPVSSSVKWIIMESTS